MSATPIRVEVHLHPDHKGVDLIGDGTCYRVREDELGRLTVSIDSATVGHLWKRPFGLFEWACEVSSKAGIAGSIPEAAFALLTAYREVVPG